jgi:dihydrofolate reductase
MKEFFKRTDAIFLGRKSYELVTKTGAEYFGKRKIYVFSKILTEAKDKKAIIINTDIKAAFNKIKNEPGKDIWLFGGSELFRAFLDCGLVDRIEVSVIPVLLGNGVPLLPPPYTPTKLTLVSSKLYRSGRVSLAYEVLR